MLLCATIPGMAEAATFRLFGTAAGLSGQPIRALAQDHDGFVYAGTQSGLYVSSGGEFARIGADGAMPRGAIRAIAAGPDGGLIVASDQGMWLRQHGRYVALDLPDIQHPQFAVLDGDYILAGDQQLWQIRTTASGPPQVRPSIDLGGKAYPQGTRGVQAAGDMLWFGCGGALCRVSAGQLTIFDTARGVPEDLWSAMLLRPDGALWARSTTRFVKISATSQVSVEAIPPLVGSQAEKSAPPFLVAAADGSVITQGGRALVVHVPGKAWQPMEWPRQWESPVITAALSDREGGLWFGSRDNGIVRLAGFPFWTSLTAENGFPAGASVATLRDERGAIWVATANGVSIYAKAGHGGIQSGTQQAMWHNTAHLDLAVQMF